MTVFTGESDYTLQAAHAASQFLTGATGLDVQDDLDAKVLVYDGSFTNLDNDEIVNMATDTVSYNGVQSKVYSGGNIINESEPTAFSAMVRDAIDNGALYDRGGFLPTQDASAYSPYMDATWLVEAAKMTGELPY